MDGLSAWFAFKSAFRYDGKVEVYISAQQRTLLQCYTPDFPGGVLGFVDCYDNAFINIAIAKQEEIFSDEAKRSMFLNNFIHDTTADLVNIVENSTETWDQLVNDLRGRMARRSSTSLKFSLPWSSSEPHAKTSGEQKKGQHSGEESIMASGERRPFSTENKVVCNVANTREKREHENPAPDHKFPWDRGR